MILTIAATLLSVVILIVDCRTPLGSADGIAYILVVVLTIWMTGRQPTIIAGLTGSLFTIAGHFLSGSTSEPAGILWTSRGLSVFGILTSAIIILFYKRADLKFVKQKENLDALFRHAMEGIVVVNVKGKITMINPKAEEQFGYEPNVLMGADISVLIPERYAATHKIYFENYFKRPLTRVIGSRGIDLVGRKKTGEEFPAEIGLTTYDTVDGRFAIAFIVDITRRKEEKKKLLTAIEELKTSRAELETFAFVAAHALQEPLRTINAFSERIMESENDRLSPEGKDSLSRVIKSGVRMRNLTDDLLSYSRLTTHARPFVKTSLCSVITGVLYDLETLIKKNKAHFSITDLPSVSCDETQIRQVFQNLLVNAIKFHRENAEPVITVSSSPSPVQKGYYDIRIEDNGIGFDEKYIEAIFHFFKRLEGKKYEGSGIGLAVVKKIVERHNGSIRVKSEPGKGSVFTVTLPQEQGYMN